jgi:RNA polymerase sigma-70 factor (ECF subfamily)
VPSSVTTDEALLCAVARGDTEALATLYDRSGPTLLALARRILGSHQEAEDLLHDVFVEVWQHAGEFDPGRGRALGWMCIRVRSRCLDRLRARARRPHGELTELDGRAADAPADRRVDATAVQRALASLAEPQRRVLELGYFAGLSSAEMAAELGIPVGTVKSRVATAVQALRRHLGEPGGHP